ncbi:MAG: AAA domain-containing protein [Rhodococcus sp. (in: high G+C Gram-positive bacteria)]|uniref:DEAD/DEAH box helicase n=1 Tax=Rhodococcus sp. SBT000017 TaxID=1803385 RepID=UPI001C7CC5BB|nr:AAA domain-containing protein [Rhodococcus sp. SBT000017]
MREQTLKGLDALIARRVRQAKLVKVTNKPLPLPERKLLTVMTSVPSPRSGWSGRTFVVLDADTASASDPVRTEVELAYEPSARRLVLTITPSTRRALGTATHVQVAYVDDFDLDLLQQLRVRLEESTRAPLVVDLWSREAVPPIPARSALNLEQRQALTAMTEGGAWLVWGPPGTGKTKVIVEAVSHALSRGRSVLITSHTNVAVDNVVKSVVEAVTVPGQVVRVGASDNLTPKVSEHPWLTVDKAAAVMTDRVARLHAIQSAVAVNRAHPDRNYLDVVIQRLERGNGVQLESALRAREAANTAQELAERISASTEESARRLSEVARVERAAESSAIVASVLPGLRERAAAAASNAHRVAEDALSGERRLTSLRVAHSDSVLEWSKATSARQSWSAGLPWRRREADARVLRALQIRDALASEVQTAQAALEALAGEAAIMGREATTAQEQVLVGESAERRTRELMRQASALRAEESAAQVHRAHVMEEHDEARRSADAVSNHEGIIATAREDGTLEALSERDEYNERVATLEAASRELDRQKKLLEDEYATTKRDLLEGAPVIACTLSSLTTKAELSNRRFDTVIVDEAASAQIAQLIYAGSKADRCLAYVGDFLQNAPITDTDDAITEDDKQVLHWQEDDIFALLGVTDRASAENNSHCVALLTQYRYPPIIAGIVNDFCYDGLLESSWRKNDELAPTPYVIFVDTAAHPRQGLRRDNESWTHPLGLDLIETIHARHRPDANAPLGLVSPYAAHARRAEALARRNALSIECGTAHKFQGRQYNVVILDLMQDSGPLRWAAQADLSGNKREVSAAKLLNVGITRAQQRLYIIGDWRVVRSTQTPGMTAIASLVGRPGFELVSALDMTEMR